MHITFPIVTSSDRANVLSQQRYM